MLILPLNLRLTGRKDRLARPKAIPAYLFSSIGHIILNEKDSTLLCSLLSRFLKNDSSRIVSLLAPTLTGNET